jgi:uncharacterized membrane protein YidH (DUF202 family)
VFEARSKAPSGRLTSIVEFSHFTIRKGHVMPRNALLIVGILLVVVGVVALVIGGFRYRERETIVDVGPVNVQAETEKTMPIPPILGGVALAAGAVCIVLGVKQS